MQVLYLLTGQLLEHFTRAHHIPTRYCCCCMVWPCLTPLQLCVCLQAL